MRADDLLRFTGLLAAMLLSVAVPSHAQWLDDQQRQAQCQLSAIGSTRSRLALDWIRTACNRLAIDTGFIDERNRLFHLCLLQYLSGVQSDAAANQVITACRTTYPP
jgi:hypothetical protein